MALSAPAAGHRPGRRDRWRRRSPAKLALLALVAGGLVWSAQADASAVFGSRVVKVGTPDHVDVGVLFGSATVVVPDGSQVSSDGTVVFGDSSCQAACGAAAGTRFDVRGYGAFGSIKIVTQTEYDKQQADESADRDD